VKGETASIESAEVTGPLQVTLHLKRPDTALVLILADRAGMMVSPTAAEARGGDLSSNPVGTGPFQFVQWLPNDRLVMKKNASYWQAGKPYLDGITIRFLTDSQTGINALLANETDLKTNVEPSDVESLRRNASVQVVTSPSLAQEECYFNFTKPPFNNLQFRQAVQYAMNRDAFNTALLFGEGTPAYQLLPKQHWAYQSDLAKPFPFDQKKARELLAASGLQGTPVRGITYDGPGQARKAEIVQAQLKEVGIDMTIETMEVGAATKTFFEGLGHDMYCAGWSGRPDPNQTMSSLFSSTGYYNAGKYSPPGLDQLIADAAKSDNTAERAKAYGPLTKAYVDNSLILSLVFRPSIVAMAKSVKGYTASLYKPDISFVWLDK
jgi:peptide/nickel transport system permease protein/peptide/nickel transport system substrate-binding protein